MNTMTTDIHRALSLLARPGRVHELRVLGSRKATMSGYYDDLDRMAQDAERVSGQAHGVYMTLNPVDPDLKARANNRLEAYAKHTTADNHILRRRWLPVDFDPVRPAGISSDATEHEAAIESARQCRDWLSTLGFPTPVLADSGNGAHLLYRISLPNDAQSTRLVEGCLKAIDFRCSDSEVGVDTGTANAARIWKVYGTLACKGDNLPERPHRLARLLEAPQSIEIVPVDLLQTLASMAPGRPEPQPAGMSQHNGSDFDLDAWIVEHQLPVATSAGWQGGRKWILNPCPWNPAHTNGAAYLIQFPNGAIAAGCHHNGCQGKTWHDLRALHDRNASNPGRRQPNYSPSTNGVHEPIIVVPAPDTTLPKEEWPEPLAGEALYGLAGEVVRAVDPHTEADPVSVLLQFLAAFGCAVGKGPYVMVGATKHEARIFPAIVGDTSKARKGDSLQPVLTIFRLADPDWYSNRVARGLSSGEGLISAVRDPTEKETGVEDKRLFAIEPEFAKVLTVDMRQGNILSMVIREAWDQGNLQTLTKSPLKATGAHIVIGGHITVDELRRELTSTQAANGFANRFIWVAVRRSKPLPRPRPFEGQAVSDLAARVARRMADARCIGAVDFALDAGRAWDELYEDLSAPRPGLTGSILARSEAQVLRLALLYALLDGSSEIEIEHLAAACALWKYSENSACFIFGDATGDAEAGTIYRALVHSGPMSRTTISGLFHRHVSAWRITQALNLLLQTGKARTYQITADNATKPTEMWEAIIQKP